MTSAMRLETGETVQLGTVIARAGEGTIYEIVGHPEWVAKVFHPDLKDLGSKRAKVAAMAGTQPSGAVQSDGFVVLTWPLHFATGDDGSTGYIMSRIDTSNAVEIHSLSNPVDRMNPLPSAPQWTPHTTWNHLVNVAANLCLAVETVHHVNAVIGDFQERNILVHDTTQVTLVDVDSIQFIADDGSAYLCGVGRPEYTAPELARVNLATTPRQKPSDLFALAVHIHQLLMGGNHPFLRGNWAGPGDQPDAMTLAAAGEWAGGPGSRLHSHPLAPPITFLPNNIQRLFVRAFTDGARDPNARPTATEWREALRMVQVTDCNRGHQIPVEADPCPWCVIDDERNTRRQQRAVAPIGAGRPPAPARPIPAAPPLGSYPGPASYPLTTPAAMSAPAKNNRTPVIIGASVAGLLAVGLVAFLGAKLGGGSDSSGSSSSSYTTYTEYPSTATVASPTARPPVGDLGLSQPISRPECDGSGVVILSSLTNPSSFAYDVQQALNAHPGSLYLKTDVTCPSLRPRTPEGNLIYAVYRPAGRTQSEICSAVRAAGGLSYGKWLDHTTDPSYIIPC